MTQTLLAYALSTDPLPLQVSTTGAIMVVANNHGGYSDQAALDYVALGGIVCDFGPRGGDAADLTASDGGTITVTPPTGWGAPTVTGLQFAFTPPAAGANLFPNIALIFAFTGIPVNAQAGTVTLTITETASSPGDPAQPSLYPEMPPSARQELALIGKFPASFSVGLLIATPPNVSAGGGTTLSWSGSPDASYSLSYGYTTITRHADQSPLQPNDLYPDPARNDPALALEIGTTFTLTAEYTPPGGSDPVTFQRQATVGVNYPGPIIEAFTLSPPWILPNQSAGATVTLAWQTSQTAGEGPVGFTLSPPLSAAELAANPGNNFFNTPHTAGGVAAFTFLQGHRVTLMALGQPGTTAAVQVSECLSFQFPPAFTAGVAAPVQLAFTPDGHFGFLVNAGPDNAQASLSAIEFVAKDDPTTWTSTPLFPGTACIGAATTPDGKHVLAVGPGALFVLTITPSQPPGAWATASIPLSVFPFLQDVVVSPDGSYAFCGGLIGVVAIAIPPGSLPGAWTTTNVTGTGLIDLGVTPDGRYLFGCGTQGGSGGLMVIEIAEAAPPSAWNSHFIPYGSAISNAVSPDGRYLFVSNQPGSVGVIDTTLDPDPARWSVAPLLNAAGPSPAIVVTPDGRFAFAASLAQPDGSAPAVLTVIQIVPGAAPSSWPTAGIFTTTASSLDILAVTPDGRYVLTPAGMSALQPVALTPPAAPPSAFAPTHLLASTMPTPLLSYSLSTDPQPLQVSTAGAITIVANNPGYSDLPAQDYVEVTAIVFDFGGVGSDGSDLTTTDGSAWAITSPAGWAKPAIAGQRFTFTPPVGKTRIFASAGLTFVFAGFTVNGETGSPTVTVTETASTPGDPANPAYPAFPTQVAVWAQLLGKFPQHFTVGDLVACPPNVPAGAPTTLALSWSGSAGAIYTLSYGSNNVTMHGDCSLLLPHDFYPDPSRSDPPLALQTDTPFTLTVAYTPPGGGTPVSLQSQITVGVYYPDPSVTSFTVSPAQFAPQVGPVAVEFTWATTNGVTGAPVSFSVDPPLSADELALNATNALFNTTHTAASSAGFTFTQGHRITLTVLGPVGTQQASSTLSLTGCATLASINFDGSGSGIAFTPDNTLAIIPQLTGGWRVLKVTADAPSAWPATQVTAGFIPEGIAITSDGKYALSVNYGPSLGLAVLTIDPTIPASQWPSVAIPFSPLIVSNLSGRVALTPDGRYAIANSGPCTAAVALSSETPPEGWTATVIDSGTSSGAVAVTPAGDYVFAASDGGILVFQPDASSPDHWTKTLIPVQATDIAITPDGSFALLVNSATGFAGAMLITPGTRPDLWRLTPFPGTFSSPKRIALTPDGRFAFISSSDDNAPIAWVWVDATQVPSAWTVETFGQTFSGFLNTGAVTSPDGKYAFVASGQTFVPIAIFPPAAKAPQEPQRADNSHSSRCRIKT